MAAENIRPGPSGGIITAACGRKNYLVSRIYQNLYEVPLDKFYPHLNFDSTLAFSARIRKLREEKPDYVSRLAELDVYHIFHDVLIKGLSWLYANRNLDSLSEEEKAQYRQLNPFRSKDLEARLARVDESDVDELKQNLVYPIFNHQFEAQYLKPDRIDDREKVLMKFQKYSYPPTKRKGKEVHQKQYGVMIDCFGKEIESILSKYPHEYFPLKPIVEETKPEDTTEQLSFF